MAQVTPHHARFMCVAPPMLEAISQCGAVATVVLASPCFLVDDALRGPARATGAGIQSTRHEDLRRDLDSPAVGIRHQAPQVLALASQTAVVLLLEKRQAGLLHLHLYFLCDNPQHLRFPPSMLRPLP
jgi:hypothetical protein